MRSSSVIEVDLTAIERNVRVVRQMIGPRCAFGSIVKADAYGLGLRDVSRCLLGAGADLLAVYTPQDAAVILRAHATGSVLVLMPVHVLAGSPDLQRALFSGRLHLTVHDAGHLEVLCRLGQDHGLRVPVHLEVDTGMSRGGCAMDEAPALLQRIAASPRLSLAGLFTHFVNADADRPLTDQQDEAFERLLRDHRRWIPDDCFIHVANTFATLRHRRFHKSMVRVGLAWAGYGPEWMRGDELIPGSQALTPCVTWTSSIVHLKWIEPGTSVGYGGAWTARRRSLIGLVPVGYADGYPRALGQTDERRPAGTVRVLPPETVAIRPGYAPVVGAVSMDQLTIDLTDLAAAGTRASGLGTTVELITPDPAAPNHLPVLARAAGSIPHEMLCRLSPRLQRVYVRSRTPAAEPVQPEGVAVG